MLLNINFQPDHASSVTCTPIIVAGTIIYVRDGSFFLTKLFTINVFSCAIYIVLYLNVNMQSCSYKNWNFLAVDVDVQLNFFHFQFVL